MSRFDMMVYGTSCGWFDTIDKVGKTPLRNGVSIPCCPKCGSVLYEMPIKDWWACVDRFELEGHPGYRKAVEWGQGRHYPTFKAMIDAYNEAHPGAFVSAS